MARRLGLVFLTLVTVLTLQACVTGKQLATATANPAELQVPIPFCYMAVIIPTTSRILRSW